MNFLLTLVLLVSLYQFTSCDILRIERWKVMESMVKEELKIALEQLQKATFPKYSFDFPGFIIPNTLTILNFRLSTLTPRLEFVNPTFYDPPNQHTYNISLPLGFHITAEFDWFYNFFIIPVSGHGIMDTDIYDFSYNATISVNSKKEISVKSVVTYSMIPIKEISTQNWLGMDTFFGIPDKLLSIISNYYPLMKADIEAAFTQALPVHFNSKISKQFDYKLYFPSFHLLFSNSAGLSDIMTVTKSLAIGYGVSTFPTEAPSSENSYRTYCLDAGLLSAVVRAVWPKMKGVYRKSDLHPDAVFQLTVPGLAMLVPDIIYDYSSSDEVTLGISADEKDLPDIVIDKYNSTHAKASGFKLVFTFQARKETVMIIKLTFDIYVTPYSNRRGTGYDFNLRTSDAEVFKNNIVVNSKYTTRIMSNVEAACNEFLDTFLPSLGFSLLGDGLLIQDDLTASSEVEYNIASNAVCLTLVKRL